MWQSREDIGRKLFATDGSFPGFSSATTLACQHSFLIVLVSAELLKKLSSQSRALGPNCLISSVWMSSRPGALLFFSTLMPMSSSAAVNALVNSGSSGYRCRSRRTFGCLFGTLPLSRSWCATWFTYVLQCCFGLRGRHKACISWTTPSCCRGSCLLIRSGSAMLYGVPLRWRSSVPTQCHGAICEGIVFVFRSVFFDQFDGLGCHAWDIVHSTSTGVVLSGDFS